MDNNIKSHGQALFRVIGQWKRAAEILDKTGGEKSYKKSVEKALWKVKNFVEKNRIM